MIPTFLKIYLWSQIPRELIQLLEEWLERTEFDLEFDRLTFIFKDGNPHSDESLFRWGTFLCAVTAFSQIEVRIGDRSRIAHNRNVQYFR